MSFPNKEAQANRRKAIKYFKSTGEWFEGCHLHHINPNQKYEDPEGYYSYNPKDLVCISEEEHLHLHENYKKAAIVSADVRRGKPLSDSAKQKLSEINTGKVIPEETKQKISDSMKGVFVGYKHSDESRKHMSEAHKGKKASEETKARMKLAQQKRRAKEQEEKTLCKSL